METSPEKSRSAEPGPQDQPLKEAEEALKNKTTAPPPSDAKDESPETAQDEEPGTFDRVYEHGRQMGF